MKIAIVAPCPVPYMVGGAEKLWWGLQAHLNEHTAHQCEIIKLPSPEADLVSLLRSYELFSTLDLGGFDVVISGKYPAWMVSHPRHVCYMLHRLRGLYDAYPGAHDLPHEMAKDPRVAALRGFMRRYAGERGALAEFFGRWNELAASAVKPPGLLDFPGPLARELVHWLDDLALAPTSIARYAAISGTVAKRPGYFPEGADVAVAYPPPHRAMTPDDRAEHFYTLSRLDGPKRMALVVEAYRGVKSDLPLVIGGTGPEEESLRRLAEGDSRVRFAGFQSDAEVRDHYRRSLAVPFVPYEEDYGLIAVEAMQCAKPVITTGDAGGPCELVEDGVTGIVCKSTARELAAAMQRLADDPPRAAALGRAGLERAAAITWEAVADTLLADTRRVAPRAGPRRKLVVATTFPIFPPRHGGQSRVFHLYRSLAPEFETVVVSVCHSAMAPFDGEIAPGLREVRVPMSEEHARRDRAMENVVGTPLTDVVMPELHAYTPAIAETLAREARDAVAVVASQPFLYPAVAKLGVPLWYECQNVETELKTALFRDLPRGAEMIEKVREVEAAIVRDAELILCASSNDAQDLVKRFGVDPAKFVDAPNGTDAQRITFLPLDERRASKARMGIEPAIAHFMGSGHWPNIERSVFHASALPEVAFTVMGSVCYAFDPQLAPANVAFLGEVDDVARNLLLEIADVALNPMEYGSGTNLKMFDFFAAGLPVITTEVGCRGLGLEDGQCHRDTRIPGAIEDVIGAGSPAAARRGSGARAGGA
jgi:glycosyltransferase involved in cell wall biosynthesis